MPTDSENTANINGPHPAAFIRRGAGFIFDLILPIACLDCGREGAWLCHNCFARLRLCREQYCPACKKEQPLGAYCRKCRADHRLEGVIIAGGYRDATLAQAIKVFKYRFAASLALPLGKYMARALSEALKEAREKKLRRSPFAAGPEHSLLVPVPLHPRRERWRGFNQSRLLAEVVQQQCALPADGGNLVRNRYTRPQTRLHKNARLNNIKGCFAWRGPSLSGQTVLLIDDVVTTGSTLNECAAVLKRSGAGKVWGLVLANG